jgi:nucleotide-binding universal stress UspA family protein
MPTIERILCPVDLSDGSRRALGHALALGSQYEASVRVLQVVDIQGWGSASVETLTSEARKGIAEQLEWWVARGATGAATASVEVREGPVVPGILAAAHEMSADLIVMSTHGRSGFERFSLGSVTEKVVRKAACPTLVVPSREDALVRVGPLGRIVCATDFSQPSVRALDYARFLGDDGRSAMSVLTVIDWPFGETHGTDPITTLRQNLEQEAADSARRIAMEAGVTSADIVVRKGKAGREILQYAREVHAELLVMGVSGRGAIDRALLGSTAHRVLRDAPCPVLLVPAAASQH